MTQENQDGGKRREVEAECGMQLADSTDMLVRPCVSGDWGFDHFDVMCRWTGSEDY